MTSQTIIAQAIRQSIRETRTVALTVTNSEWDDLFAECEDYADENDGTRDVWGADDDGNEWRLCVTIAD